MTRAVFGEDVAARKGVASQYPEVVRPNILRQAAAVKKAAFLIFPGTIVYSRLREASPHGLICEGETDGFETT